MNMKMIYNSNHGSRLVACTKEGMDELMKLITMKTSTIYDMNYGKRFGNLKTEKIEL